MTGPKHKKMKRWVGNSLMLKPAGKGISLIMVLQQNGTYKILIINKSSVGKYFILLDTKNVLNLYVFVC